jgi:hypothetical protein
MLKIETRIFAKHQALDQKPESLQIKTDRLDCLILHLISRPGNKLACRLDQQITCTDFTRDKVQEESRAGRID